MMTIADQIENEIREQYKFGAIQEDFAKKYRVSQQYIQKLLSGVCKWSGLTAGKINKMFPHAALNLRGDISSTAGGLHSTSIIGDNNVTTCDELKHKIIAFVMASDLEAGSKVKVFNIVETIK